MGHDGLAEWVMPRVRCHVACVKASVDRLCVGLEEDDSGEHPTVRAWAEAYGSLKPQRSAETEWLSTHSKAAESSFPVI